MASENPKLIILGSFGYMNDGLGSLPKRPDIDFIHASGYKTTQNFGWFLSRNYESAYAAGIAAGYVTKSKILGVVAAYPVPEVLAMINGLTLGAHKVNPDVTVKVVWLNSWFDPNKSQEAARSLRGAEGGRSVFAVSGHTRGGFACGTARRLCDQHVIGHEQIRSQMVPRWTARQLEQILRCVGRVSDRGDVQRRGLLGGMKDGCVSVVAISHDLKPEQRKVVDDAIAAMTAGTFHPMTGPVTSQDGELKLKPGEVMADGPLLGINWLVKGVETRIPK